MKHLVLAAVFGFFAVGPMCCLAVDLFTSISGLERLLETEKQMAFMIRDYVDLEMERLHRLKELSTKKVTRMMPVMKNGEALMLNPIDSFRLVNSIVADKNSVLSLLHQNPATELMGSFPSLERASQDDLFGAATALLRLQDTYLLDPEDIANGKILDKEAFQRMTSDDCFLLAYSASTKNDWYHSVQWFSLAFDRYIQENTNHTSTSPAAVTSFNLTVIYDYLAYSMHQTRNAELAVYYSKLLNEIDPTYPNAAHVEIYERILEEVRRNGTSQTEPVIIDSYSQLPYIYNPRPVRHFPTYEALCRGETVMDPKESSELYCYWKRNNAYLFLAPIKVEVLKFDPRVVIFHDAISENERQQLVHFTEPMLQRALVVNEKKNTDDEPSNVPANYRIAKNAWLSDDMHPVVARISRRIVQMTDLSVDYAETLQMANYGIGGQYEPHFDMALEGQGIEVNDPMVGNRLATMLFYLSQPEAGGATVFESLRIGVQPQYLSALFWFNLHRDGRPDLRTRHAGCPVLLGQKWVANKWLHERGNEFTLPCMPTADSNYAPTPVYDEV